jgi:hypothetical protein
MEFFSNQCNLECVMCDGNHSSAMLQRRDQLPSLPKCYSDDFFSSYLLHLTMANFLGGEPFCGTFRKMTLKRTNRGTS